MPNIVYRGLSVNRSCDDDVPPNVFPRTSVPGLDWSPIVHPRFVLFRDLPDGISGASAGPWDGRHAALHVPVVPTQADIDEAAWRGRAYLNYASRADFWFDGDTLNVIVPADEEPTRDNIRVVIRRVCEVLGVDFSSQLQKLKEAAWGGVGEITTPSAGGPQRTQTIPLKALPMWLARLNPGKVRPELRAKIIRYQCEAADALADHFLGHRELAALHSHFAYAAPLADWRLMRERRLNAKLLLAEARETDDPSLRAHALFLLGER